MLKISMIAIAYWFRKYVLRQRVELLYSLVTHKPAGIGRWVSASKSSRKARI